MDWRKFENFVGKVLQRKGYWALIIPKNQRGAQPFDVIAIKDGKASAIDCKVCSHRRFPVDRVEDNQWTAFELISSKGAEAFFLCYYDSTIYKVPYDVLVKAQAAQTASIVLK